MKATEFNDFRLVGGTSLSLQIGHRLSIDIDLFTDVIYDSINQPAKVGNENRAENKNEKGNVEKLACNERAFFL